MSPADCHDDHPATCDNSLFSIVGAAKQRILRADLFFKYLSKE